MPYRTIMVHADAGAGTEGRVRLAAELAVEHRARLIGAVARLPRPLIEVHAGGSAIFTAGLIDDVPNDDCAAAFKLAEADFFRWIVGRGLDSDWRAVVDFPAIGLAGLSAAADLIVVGNAEAPSSLHGNHDLDLGDLVMKAGRPVLVIPPDRERLVVRAALIAWKNTREARRALSDALPLFKSCERVVLLHANEGDGEDASLADARAFLERHEIKATTEASSVSSRTFADQIVATAGRHRVDLVVAGAYGHTRLREWALGGVTRELLGHAPVPCLFSH